MIGKRAVLFAAIAEGMADLEPPTGFENRHRRLTSAFATFAARATEARITASRGDTDSALAILKRSEERFVSEVRTLPSVPRPDRFFSRCKLFGR